MSNFEDFSDLSEALETIPAPKTATKKETCSFCGHRREACSKHDALPLEVAIADACAEFKTF